MPTYKVLASFEVIADNSLEAEEGVYCVEDTKGMPIEKIEILKVEVLN